MKGIKAMKKNSDTKIKANAKYENKTYKTYKMRFRIEEDNDIIESIETAKANGLSYREWLRTIFDKK